MASSRATSRRCGCFSQSCGGVCTCDSGKSAQSSVQPCSGLQRTAPIVHRLECRAQRKMQQLSRYEQAARRVVEQLLAAEAALAYAAEERSLHESATRRQAEAQRDVWRAIAGDRGSRGGRGGRGHAPQQPPPPPPPTPQSPPPQPPPAPPAPAPPPAPPQPPLEEEQEAQAQEEQRARQLDFALAQLASTMQILEDTFDWAVPNPGSATEDELRQMLKSYKRASLRLHPDKGGDPETYAIFQNAFQTWQIC